MDSEFDPYGLPPETMSPAHMLIGMMGLDTSKAVHKAVWEIFATNRRNDRTAMTFKQLPSELQLPPMKSKRQSYEWYIPKGILKSNWMMKYLSEVPGLIVIFYDLDWNDPAWSEKKNDLAAQVQKIRAAIGSFSTRIAIVLIQSGVSVPGEDTGAAEKAATLCSTCDLPAKHLFVLPYSDAHLFGYTVRLENALSEIAGGFYMGEAKGVRAHRDFLNKTSHQLLFVRHQFKLGFHNEMRNDPQTAIKHYAQCYHHLLELRSTDTNLHEIRIVAAIANYKICQLDFQLNLPRDAIAQFRRHIDMFRQRTGPKELIFEHYAWLSKQYEIFGKVFEEAVHNGLPAVQTQHPGFYFQQAALYAVVRRKTALQICKDDSPTGSDLLKGWKDLEFYGQRPWRPGKHSLEPPEPQRETEGIKALQYHELKEVKHASYIIPLFSSAISQFKKYRCPRIKKHLMVQMAEEYLEAQDPAKALTLLNHVMWDYRHERWWKLLSSASTLALHCAYQTGTITDYIALALEFIGPRVISSSDEKKRVFNNLVKLLSGEVPDSEPSTDPEVITAAASTWSSLLHSPVLPVTVDMSAIIPCLEVRATFTTAKCRVNEVVGIIVRIRNSYSESIQLYKLSIGINSHDYGEDLEESKPESLLITPGKVTEIHKAFRPLADDIGNSLKIASVSAQLSDSSSGLSVNLQWSGAGDEGVTVHAASTPVYKEFRLLSHNEFDTINIISEVEILSLKPNLQVTLSYDETALVWEWLPITVRLCNEEESPATDVSLSLGLDAASEATFEQTTQIGTASTLESKRYTSQLNQHSIGELTVGAVEEQLFYVKSLTAAQRYFILKITYMTSRMTNGSQVRCPCVCTKSFSIVAKIPFQVTIETQSLKFEKLTHVVAGESFVVIPRITSFAHVPVTLTGSSLSLANNIQFDSEAISHVKDTELSGKEVGVDCFCISVKPSVAISAAVSLGQYLLYWRRYDSCSPPVSVSVGLPSVIVESQGLWVDADLPSQGTVRTPMPVAYVISNRGNCTVELALSMHSSDAFMFSGHKEARLRILPGSSEKIQYTLYPLLAGNVQLPRLSLNTDVHHTGAPSSLSQLLSRILPTHIYIMPQRKSSAMTEKTAVITPIKEAIVH